MTKHCVVCGNDYDKPLEITYRGRTKIFDCFECAIHDLAPKCTGCGLRILGHGMEVDNAIFCSAHCAHTMGNFALSDRISAKVVYGHAEL